ncbi:MAG: S-layer homology domain-containing protein [Candidatus Margulisbacteria bacterium]|nr:S-layer homology domain-containing protein [Candidatus Margulisiibacteriota bacterium]
MILLSLLAAETPNVQLFSDVPRDHWAFNAVRHMVDLDVVKGYPDGTLHGDEKISRYDTLVYLNNLSLSMETMLDKKLQLEQPAFQNVSANAVATQAIVDLKNEVAALKLELAELKGAATVNVPAAPVAAPRESTEWPALLKDNLVIDSYYFYTSKAATGNDMLDAPRLFVRADLNLSRDFGLSGFAFTLKRNYTSAAAWAGRELADFARLRFEASAGPGQVIDQDRRVVDNPANSLSARLGLWGLSLSAAQSQADSAVSTPAVSHLNVSRQTLAAKFDFSPDLPFFGAGNIFYQVDTYSGEGKAVSNNETVRAFTTRALSGLHFELAARRFLTLRYLQDAYKNGYTDLSKKQSYYYDALLSLGGLFADGLDLDVMYAYKGAAFGANQLGEDAPGVNLLGYASCAYLTDDIFGENRIPNAKAVSETGVKLTNYLYQKELTLEIVYIYGVGLPDDDISPADTKYLYDHYGARLSWYLLPGSAFYLGYEKLDLFDSAIEKAADQLTEELVKFGLRFAF